ncbi:hypothetical protein H4582DRAFT_2055566 [Lactarius indigo]|nr:hypothetical protein H4582DRAFT_2055566 [Lactarius indigo]
MPIFIPILLAAAGALGIPASLVVTLLGAAGGTTGIVLALIMACCCCVTPIVACVALGVVVFGTAGLVAGFILLGAAGNRSMAAGIQIGIGSVTAGSLLAAAQSMAMDGAVPTAVAAVGAGMGAVGGAAASATSVAATVASVGVVRPWLLCLLL